MKMKEKVLENENQNFGRIKRNKNKINKKNSKFLFYIKQAKI